MKTKPMKHQIDDIAALAANETYYALGSEQGTGKTWSLLADAERQYLEGKIEGLLIVAPKGVHTNWVVREIPVHLEIESRIMLYFSPLNKKRRAELKRLLEEEDSFRILSINIDAVNTTSGFQSAAAFLKRGPSMMIVDESQRIKNSTAKRTGRVINLGKMAKSRRISSGTIISNGPIDAFSQFEFLKPGLLGTTSRRAFVAEYAVLEPSNSHVVQHAKSMSRGKVTNPQIVRRDERGNPMYRNLERLNKLMEPHMRRVLKKDCLDLPPKVYRNHYFELTPAQRVEYDEIRNNRTWVRPDGDVDMFTALSVITKLQQITSGFIMVDGAAARFEDYKPRLDALREVVEDVDGQFIVWAVYREELLMIADELEELGVSQYHGGIKDKDREKAVDDFQSGATRVFVANPATAGEGLTLTAASTVIYYSNNFSLQQRLQSEDRSHRRGSIGSSVVYVDLVARGTIDGRIAAALQSKAGTARAVLGD